MDMKKKIVVGTIIFILCGFLLLEFFPNYVLELFSWHGKSFNAYRNRAYTGGAYTVVELPQGSQDFRYQSYHFLVASYSYAAFTLTGDDYTNYIASISEMEDSINPDGSEFIGKKVYETMDIYKDDMYIGFPHLRCDFVIDDNIKDYVIIYYDYYYGAGTKRNAVVVNPDTGRVVVFNGAGT